MNRHENEAGFKDCFVALFGAWVSNPRIHRMRAAGRAGKTTKSLHQRGDIKEPSKDTEARRRLRTIRSMEEEEGEEEEAGTTGSFQPRRKSPNRSSSQAPRVTTSLELACASRLSAAGGRMRMRGEDEDEG
ncbi:predicted protein [Histoplasma capsulatum G186AR]|uniref:Uncharacterized protein n=1 Tax=Ajellomyces capsulatus (strain G186AR / H82 / ATCC MYA-2454 / RMSCC 2432) TaxID=447093 RepID=C0NKL0_AJECG|nr:uncharacterized protein HCBG_03690 [Histoplasma capsulatum G186AR]EEH08401.1 predicted protein [Histoplasma capsulatum G186AR]